ncbi:YcbK family protein [Christiangramia crocea]|uniref:D-Ala-D-Ala carboxypeptidase family metallohydrolase n=1 Tax=Christiangramia crocea TaxID=2904124 RepID=A0A9X1UX72_9FLAO|nr:D-Ala-D-Ala carboxypeptidase family metallohydrolase [Gramella crocea]MCG9970978.1 D-Ala-D-Ala carboxypeptidase family metallohydrolase [Gramella crocea]
MRLSEHFNLSEFESHDGAETPCDVKVNLKELALNLEVLRAHLDVPVMVNSGYRSPYHNKRIGGAPKSQHLLGKAADIRTLKYSPRMIHAAIEQLISEGKMKQGGLGLYQNFVHYDIRGTKARW